MLYSAHEGVYSIGKIGLPGVGAQQFAAKRI